MDINTPIQYIKGIGPKRAKKFNSLGIYTLYDCIYYFPRQYEDKSRFKKINEVENEEKISISGVIIGFESRKVKENINISKIKVKDNTGIIDLVFFNQSYILGKFNVKDEIVAYGKIKIEFGTRQMISPQIELKDKENSIGNITPIYSLKNSITNNEVSNLIKLALDNIDHIQEYLPENVINENKLCSIDFAIRNIHFPQNRNSLKIALYRLVFEEFLILQLGLFYLKSGSLNKNGISIRKSPKLYDIINNLPFSLTKAQMNALEDILNDMESKTVMNRLVQGDVGSGKTVVALLALANCALNGYQGAMMAPTEILAEQHFNSLNEILSKFGIKVDLLVGSLTKKEKEDVLNKIENGYIDILVGTHALIEENVKFKNLALVITDEQHRFGVTQRNKLSTKGENPDVLVMTATPIPRTLALILYGDLDVSIIDELPPGRQKIDTFAVPKEKRDIAYGFVKKQVKLGRQVYIVCPLVEESEAIQAKAATELLVELKENYFSNLRLGLLHGKMKPSEKDEVMKQFKNGDIDILVSTTVVEVGVNVPNATLMIVEDAERFGLAQLHQLRGRVGRGEHKSYCILIYGSKTEIALQRMKIMEQTTDGFKISEQDLKLRGPGEFFGTRQHGIPELKIANIFKHMDILKKAQKQSRLIIMEDPNLTFEKNKKLKQYILNKFKDKLDNISLN
ncbi:ATP-dependent DNA helicase RecG [Alkalithermobacter thermoalcaliphilus JW-YL-7 = DSM 7308]|uniref:ATP-dependent DNA helicase RecG n=1 Tax=Alkalithermobacter thermoalcaliphilus JW-YL-7 = DSM 7308 TaxID=1121328 RepID=A0A150FPS8_CLOPD|nr:ATP-dependent DNA helicase RecG [[Clostridium] paradoxum JW-YL-7 = DSM 7308]SHK95890.1 ATP-dependent DNA helicase RecG [[Clostridium] paradoxum JW-YL-7 = DSM 7308]